MSTATRPPLGSRLLRIVLAPAFRLERAKGRERVGLVLLYALVGLVIGVLLWREASLNGLPDIGDPFDVATFGDVSVPDEENAFVLYRQAADRLGNGTVEVWSDLSGFLKGKSPEPGVSLLTFLNKHREPLELWRRGTERPRALHVRPADQTIHNTMSMVHQVRTFAQLACVEGWRREQEGDLAGAWAWYGAALRSSRHVASHGGFLARVVAHSMYSDAANRAMAWADDPRVDSRLLRRALDDAQAIAAMTPPNSDALKVEYLMLMNAFEDRTMMRAQVQGALSDRWYGHISGTPDVLTFFLHEPERSRRVTRLLFANWLAQVDRPRDLRAAFVSTPNLVLYDSVPPAPGLGPEVLDRWFQSALFARLLQPTIDPVISYLDSDRVRQTSMILELAEQLYARDHGARPKSPGALLGKYLDRLPDGVER